MENKYSIEISKSFNIMLFENLYTYTLYSKSYANTIHTKVYFFFEILKSFPYSFPLFYLNDNNSNLRKYVIDKRFLIVYEIENNIIKILYFVDGRRSYDNMFTY